MIASKVRGTTTIEFAMGAMVLIISTLAIFEICYNIYVVNVTEYALRETIRSTKTYQGESIHRRYQQRFETVLKQDGMLWHFLITDDQFDLSAKYFKNYRDFVDNIGVNDDTNLSGYALAEVTLSYRYTPMLALFSRAQQDISRTMVLNLEHEGWPSHAGQ